MRKIVFIWNELPDRTRIFVFKVSDREKNFYKLLFCHGKLVSDDPDWIRQFVSALPDEACVYDTSREWNPVYSILTDCTLIYSSIQTQGIKT